MDRACSTSHAAPTWPRPDSLWIGNHTGIGSPAWNDVELFRVHVRKPNPADALFYDMFE
jgi:hypothetical protein